jgi:hypothetical protein
MHQGPGGRTSFPHAWSVSADISTMSGRADLPNCGTARRRSQPERHQEESSISEGPSSVQIGSVPIGAGISQKTTSTNARGVALQSTGPTPASSRRPEIRTPLVAIEWKSALDAAHIAHRYPQIPHFITYGADAGIGPISTTFTPPNHPSIIAHQEVFQDVVDIEFQKGRYWGPFSRTELEEIIGPFQTSPISLIPKPGKPGKFRLIHTGGRPLLTQQAN